jgi:kumamolisin
MASTDRISIPGSKRKFAAGHTRVAEADAQERATVTLYLRDRASLGGDRAKEFKSVSGQGHLTREEWAETHGASEEDVAAVRAFAAEYDLTVEQESAARRMLRLSGTLGAIAAAFGVQELALFKHPDGTTYRARQGELSVPAKLAGIIVGVFGIDNRPQARAHLRKAAHTGRGTSYTPPQVAEAYGFPTDVNGAGETIAIIELGGGYSESDLATYFASLSIPLPSVKAQSVDGESNTPGGEADVEVMLDIEVAGAIAPGAAIVVYFTPNTDAGFIDAVSHRRTPGPSRRANSWSRSSPRRRNFTSRSPSPPGTTDPPTASKTATSTSTSRPARPTPSPAAARRSSLRAPRSAARLSGTTDPVRVRPAAA